MILYHNVVIIKGILKCHGVKVYVNQPCLGRIESKFMIITKKHLIPIIVIGMLVSGIPGITICSANCTSSDQDLDSLMDGSCPIMDHSFVQIAIVLSALLVFPLVGLFLSGERQFIPPGVHLPPYRPPRLALIG